MISLDTPLGPIEYRQRDLVAMPRNAKPSVLCEPEQLRGVTIHYTGGSLAGYYNDGLPLVDADSRVIAAAIRNHNARTGKDWVSDVGYNWGVGRSGVIFEMRSLTYRNAANGSMLQSDGTLLPRCRGLYPPGVTSSNRYWVSLFMVVGTDPGFNDATEAQWEAAKKAIAYIASTRNIANCKVNGHRDVRATACPGNVMYPRLGELVPGAVLPPLPPIPPTGCECAAAIERAKQFRLVEGDGYPPTTDAEQDAVYWLQFGLNRQMPAGVTKLVQDRKFGTKTERALIAFQKAQLADDIAHGRTPRMVVDGVCYKQTWGRLYP